MRTRTRRSMIGPSTLLVAGALALLGGAPAARAATAPACSAAASCAEVAVQATLPKDVQIDLATCTMNSECPAEDFCSKSAGDCGGTGTCAMRPQACSKLIDYVCGCDGNTYDNPCLANRAGVNISHHGPC